MADMAMRAEIYMKTNYEQDLERRTRFEQQQKKEQIKSEREAPMIMQMGGCAMSKFLKISVIILLMIVLLMIVGIFVNKDDRPLHEQIADDM